MQYIHSKDIFMLLRDTLKLFDRRLMDHGSKVAYYVYKMLQYKGGYDDYELADIAFLTTFHDIGAYRTENVDLLIRFETKESKAHCFYGYLFMRGLTQVGEMAKVILYHHTDFAQLEKMNYEHNFLVSCISLAEMVDLFCESLGDKFSMEIFQKQLGTKYSPAVYRLFMEANQRYDLLGQIRSKGYKQELDGLMDSFILRNNEKEKLLRFLMFTLALKSETAIVDTVTGLALSEKLGLELGLAEEQQELLRYAGYIKDIGMMAMSRAVLENQGKVTQKELEKVKQHTLLMERLLKDKMKKEVIFIAATHHERSNGSGYPRKLVEKQLSLPQEILLFADALGAFFNPHSDRPAWERERMIEYVKKQTGAGAFNQSVAKIFLEKYDEIAEYVKNKSREELTDYRRLNVQYMNAMEKKEQ